METVGTTGSVTFERPPPQRMLRISPFTPITPAVIQESIGIARLSYGELKYGFKEGAFIWVDSPLPMRPIEPTLKVKRNTTRFSQRPVDSAP